MSALRLYPYQEQLIPRLRERIKECRKSGVPPSIILYLPTGAGKTEIAAAIMRLSESIGCRVGMIHDRVILCAQTSARLDKYDIDHGVYQAGHPRRRPHKFIQVLSAQTTERSGIPADLKLLINDEAHHVRAQTLEFIRRTGIPFIGLTASPDTKGIKSKFPGGVVSGPTVADLVEMGRLVPLKVYIAKEIGVDGVKKRQGDYDREEVGRRGKLITGDIVAELVSKSFQHFGRMCKSIVFCASVAHGADLAEQFAAAGYNFVTITYRDSQEFKREAIAEFQKEDSSIHGLIAVDILTKGFDCPGVLAGVDARPSTSFANHQQRMGRVMRAAPGKQFGLWLDHSGNYLRFKEDWERRYHEGVTELTDEPLQPRKEPTQQQKAEAKCPVCGHLWPGEVDVCPGCGHVRPRRNEVVTVAGEMEEVESPIKADMETKQRWWNGLLYVCQKKGHNPGWASHRFREKFGVWPSGLQDAPEPSREVSGWLTHRNIARAKALAKERSAQ
jgi:superfamily II DNA or RNA helicase